MRGDQPASPEPHGTGAGRDVARLLELLNADPTHALTVADMHDAGIGAPAQAIYTLQLAGYDIDRVFCVHPDGHRTPGYQLRVTSVLAGHDPAGSGGSEPNGV